MSRTLARRPALRRGAPLSFYRASLVSPLCFVHDTIIDGFAVKIRHSFDRLLTEILRHFYAVFSPFSYPQSYPHNPHFSIIYCFFA
jgi:hypothetical protein